MLFFVMVYGIISFGIPMAVRMGMQHYSAEAARAALAVGMSTDGYESKMKAAVDDVLNDSWIAPWIADAWIRGCTLSNEWQKIAGSEYTALNKPAGLQSHQLQVCLESNYDFVPSITLMGIDFPPLPRDGEGRLLLRAHTITTL